MSRPQSVIRILDVPLSNRYEHTYYFESKAEQSAFFNTKVIATFTGYTYIRKSWDLQVNVSLEEAESWRYLTFRNSGTGKDYYYFINNVEYVNGSNVNLALEMDVMQTYVDDYTLKESFIERQHVRNDKIGAHTLQESLELGNMVSYHNYDMEDLQEMCVLMLSSVDLTATSKETAGTVVARNYDGVYSGLAIYAGNELCFQNTITKFTAWGLESAIVAMWMYPKNLVQLKNNASWSNTVPAEVDSVSCDFGGLANWSNYKSDIFGGFKPDNNKLYTYPFNYLYATNNSGGSAVFHFERWDALNVDNGYPFAMFGALSPDAGVKVCPVEYKGVNGTHYEEGLTIGAYPTCAWSSDTWKIWLAQNQHSLQVQDENAIISAVVGGAQVVGSAVSGNVSGVVGGTMGLINQYQSVRSMIAQRQDMKARPPQASGSHSANVNVSANRHTISFYYKCVTKEIAMIIDDYFNRYGYTINRIAVPDCCARERYTFVKTVGCMIDGKLCAEDTAKIMTIFDNGITFWVDWNGMGTYGDNLPKELF